MEDMGHVDWDKNGEYSWLNLTWIFSGFYSPFLQPSVMRFSMHAWKCAFFLFLRPHDSGSHAIKVLLVCHRKKNGVINEGCRQHLLQVLHVRKKCVGHRSRLFIFCCRSFMLMRSWEWVENWKAVIKFPCKSTDPVLQPKHTGGKVEVALRMQRWGCLLLTPALLEER